MPFLGDDEIVTPGFMPQIRPAPEAPAPTWTEIWDAASSEISVEALAGKAGEAFTRSRTAPIAGYDPFSDIAGYEDNAMSFVSADSPQEVALIKQKIDSEHKADAIIAASGVSGIAAAFAAGVIDPVNLLPGGVAFSAARDMVTGGRALRAALEAGSAGLVASGAAEAILQSTQETRTAQESAMNIAASTLLSGLMGSALGAVARGEIPGAKSIADLEQGIGADLGLPGHGSGGSVGAAAARTTTLEQEGVKSALWAEKLSQHNVIVGTPLHRTLSSPSVEVRRVAGDLAEVKLIQNKNAEGIPSLPSVEQNVRAWHAPMAEALGAVDAEFLRYRLGPDAKPGVLRLMGTTLRDMVRSPDQLTYMEFREAVARAMRNNDTHEIPEVANAAREVRTRIVDPLKNEAIAARLLPEDVNVTTAPSYITRLYDTPRIIARRPEFESRIALWLSGLRDDAARMQDQRLSVEPDSKIAKALEGERQMAELSDDEIRAIAQEVTDTIIGMTPGRINYGPVPLARGPLKERTLNIPDAMIEDFLHNDIEHIIRAYTRTMATDVELTKKFGRADMQDQLDKINDSYARLRDGVTDEKKLKELDKRQRSDIQDIVGMRDRIRGTYAIPSDPDSLLIRTSRVVRQLNFLRLLGGMTISSVSDAARPVMIHGLSRFMSSGLRPLIAGAKLYRLAANEAKLAGTALDMVLDSRAMQLADIWDDYGRFSPLERGIQAMTDRFGVVTAMAPWNAFWKQFSGVMSQTRSLQAIDALGKGRASQGELERLAFLGIGKDMAPRIAEQFARHGEKDSGIWWANTAAWTDREAANAFRHAIAKEVDITIVTPGQDRPLWMSTELGKIIGQFRSFTMSSMAQVTQLGLQRRDAAFLQGVVLSVGLGMLSMVLRKAAKGDPLPDDPMQWISEGVDRSAVLSWIMDANSIAEKVTRDRVGLAMLTGKPTSSRYESRNAVGAVLGPTFGLVSDAFEATGAAAAGDWTAGDTNKIRQMMPYQNLFYMRRLFNLAESGFNEALGVPDKKRVN